MTAIAEFPASAGAEFRVISGVNSFNHRDTRLSLSGLPVTDTDLKLS